MGGACMAGAMSLKDLERAMELAGSSYRPKEILELQQEIKGETRAAEIFAAVTGKADPAKIQRIVEMRLELDRLYSKWIAGDIS